MMAHERITAAIAAATKAGRPALVAFITAGSPEPGESPETLKAVATVGDVVEPGFPSYVTVQDGLTIARPSFTALR